MRPGNALLRGHAPVNVTPAVFAATVLIGNTSTITPGTWSGSPPPTLTYTLRRDGVAVGGATNLSHAAAEAYAFVAADIYPSLTWLETATNPSGAPSAASNAQAYSVVGSLAPAAWFRTDLVTVVSSAASAWPDQSGNGRDLTQGTAGLRPAYGAASGAGGTPGLAFDGTDDVMNTAAFALPQPCVVMWVGKLVAWVINKRFYGDPGTGAQATLITDTATPQVVLFAGAGSVAANTNLAVGAFALVEALYSDAASALRVNATAATTGNPGTAGFATGFRWGQDAGGYTNTIVSEIVLLGAALTAAQRLNYRAYTTNRYGVP